jgi:hypothetical protein
MKTVLRSSFIIALCVMAMVTFTNAQKNLITNGTFGTSDGWLGPMIMSGYTVAGNYDFNCTADTHKTGTPPCLRISYSDNTVQSNSVIYQPVTLEAGTVYIFDAAVKDPDPASINFWCEFYLTQTEPTDGGADVTVANGATAMGYIKYHGWQSAYPANYNGLLSALPLPCSAAPDSIKGTGSQTWYFVVKSGCNGGGTYNVLLDSLVLKARSAVGVENEAASVAKTFNLQQNYPNPFNPSTKFTYQMSKAGFVSIKVYDLLGREVATLVNEVKQAGSYPVEWNAAALNSGVYFCKMQTGSFDATKKMILMK